MCVIIVQGEIKKSCCNCGGVCKREQKWTKKMNRIAAKDEAVNLTVLLQKAQLLQHHNSLMNAAKAYEESYHL